MADVDYGYGDQCDYGYGDTEPEMIAEDVQAKDIYYSSPENGIANNSNKNELDQARRPKRRCSVTKFTLESGDTPTSLTAASVIANLRNGIVPQVASTTTMDDTPTMTMITPNQSADFDSMINDDDENDIDPNIDMSTDDNTKKGRNGMLRLLSLRR
jgi:hypothetical protein